MSDRFEVDGIVYDRNHQPRPTGGTYIAPEHIPPVADDECLCGTGFVCVAHPQTSRGQLTWDDE